MAGEVRTPKTTFQKFYFLIYDDVNFKNDSVTQYRTAFTVFCSAYQDLSLYDEMHKAASFGAFHEINTPFKKKTIYL